MTTINYTSIVNNVPIVKQLKELYSKEAIPAIVDSHIVMGHNDS